MKLWTIQPKAVYELIQRTGVYRCEAGKSEFLDESDPTSKPFYDAYGWMAAQMNKRIGERPCGVKYPVWAWYRYEGKEKPDIRKERWVNGHPGEEFACILLEVPDSEVLLSDYGLWHHVLNGWPITETEAESIRADEFLEKKPYEERRRYLEKNWERVFKTGIQNNGWVRRGYDLQATFWELKKEYVTGVKFFTCGRRKNYP